MDYKIIESTDKTKRIEFSEGYNTVIIPTIEDKNTGCVSCQIGCPIGCKFCHTGKKKFKRNLSYQEIIDQVNIASKIIGKKPTTVVFMGQGEPLLNLENVLKAAEELHEKFFLAYNHITISTSGCGKLDKLLNVPFGVAISLHSPFDRKRRKLIPGSITVSKIVKFGQEYCSRHNKKTYIMVEYAMIDGVNDSENDLKKLLSFKWPKRTLFNLIEFNPLENFKASSKEKMMEFKNTIIEKGWKCFIRKSRGQDIGAACGMLS